MYLSPDKDMAELFSLEYHRYQVYPRSPSHKIDSSIFAPNAERKRPLALLQSSVIKNHRNMLRDERRNGYKPVKVVSICYDSIGLCSRSFQFRELSTETLSVTTESSKRNCYEQNQ